MAKTIGQLTQATTLASGDEFVIEQSGLTKRVAASVVRGGLVNADIDAAAAIAFSKLAALDSANLLVGNGSNVATKVAVTGDVTISNAGVTAIGSSKVVTAMITDANVTTAKIADANVTPAKLSQPLTLASAVTATGTSIDFTGIPSWVRRITVFFYSVSTSGTSPVIIQVGDGSFVTSGYSSHATGIDGSVAGSSSSSDGFLTEPSPTAAAFVRFGISTIETLGSGRWMLSSTHGVSGSANARTHVAGGGAPILSGNLDRVRITTVNGTDTFDAGSVNIMYEG
jgi:hypothetical protein